MTDPLRPIFETVDLTELVDAGVLMAANERFFWPLGLALAWTHNKESGVASNLHVREWQWTDGHHETIGFAAGDQVVLERRRHFAEWVDARIASLPPEERAAAEALAVEPVPAVEVPHG